MLDGLVVGLELGVGGGLTLVFGVDEVLDLSVGLEGGVVLGDGVGGELGLLGVLALLGGGADLVEEDELDVVLVEVAPDLLGGLLVDGLELVDELLGLLDDEVALLLGAVLRVLLWKGVG